MVEVASLDEVPLREVWPDEARDFTPWLAANPDQLGKELHMDLEFEGEEVPVGPFSADVVLRDANTGQRVVVENLLETTDHDHLGKLITYAAALEAHWPFWSRRRFVLSTARRLPGSIRSPAKGPASLESRFMPSALATRPPRSVWTWSSSPTTSRGVFALREGPYPRRAGAMSSGGASSCRSFARHTPIGAMRGSHHPTTGWTSRVGGVGFGTASSSPGGPRILRTTA